MNAEIKWTHLSRAQIIKAMARKGVKVSKNIVKKLLKKHKFVKRKMQKTQSIGSHKDRNEQFLISILLTYVRNTKQMAILY